MRCRLCSEQYSISFSLTLSPVHTKLAYTNARTSSATPSNLFWYFFFFSSSILFLHSVPVRSPFVVCIMAALTSYAFMCIVLVVALIRPSFIVVNRSNEQQHNSKCMHEICKLVRIGRNLAAMNNELSSNAFIITHTHTRCAQWDCPSLILVQNRSTCSILISHGSCSGHFPNKNVCARQFIAVLYERARQTHVQRCDSCFVYDMADDDGDDDDDGDAHVNGLFTGV